MIALNVYTRYGDLTPARGKNMNILDRLNSGQIHAEARINRPSCVDALGNIHRNSKRAEFVNLRAKLIKKNGQDFSQWPKVDIDKLEAKQ